MLTLCVLLEDALCTGCWYSAHWFYYLHIDVDAVWNSCWHCMHWLLIDTTSNVFWLIHVLSIEQEQIFSCLLVAVYSNKLFFFHSHPTPMSFCTQGLTGVAESTVSKSDKTFSLEGEGARRADEGEIGNQPENPLFPLDLLIHFTGISWSLSP